MTDNSGSTIERLRSALNERYLIERELGAGGMATVYLAHDSRHDRDVAIKVLRPDLAAVIGAERFLAEIKTTANLQHPHILSLFDSGEIAGTVFYVMPFVAGESLRDRLSHAKQLPVDEALRIAREVADALAYAHARGIIHRDIKPENILLHGGHALVADFGIALAVSRTEGGSRMTETGMSLGTPHYMSPEQAMGEKDVAPSADIYALGCVLYEMLVGEPPFTGPTAQAIVAKLLTSDPVPVTTLRKTVPPHIDAALETALQKLPADRFESAAAFAAALDNTMARTMASASARSTTKQRTTVARAFARYAPWLLVVVAFGTGFFGWFRERAGPVSQFAVAFPAQQAPAYSMVGTHVGVSRDGSFLVYSGDDSVGNRLVVKRNDELTVTSIPGTESGYDPFISPDGKEVGFVTDRDGRTLKIALLAGGPPRVIVSEGIGTSGAAWGSDGYIYYDADTGGLMRVRPDGSGRETVMALDPTKDESGFAWPRLLPDNKVIIMRLRHGGDSPTDFSVLACRIATKQCNVLSRGVSGAYSNGFVLIATSDGVLQAARFDERHLTISNVVTIASGLRVYGTYAGVDIATSENGPLYYVTGISGEASQLQWLDRDGTTHIVDPQWRESGVLRALALSPDGNRVALDMLSAGPSASDIWIKQLPGGPLTRLTLDAAPDSRPSWSADGRYIYFLSQRVKPTAIFRRPADGTGSDVLFARADRPIAEVYESPDGHWLLARTGVSSAGQGDILAMQIGKDTAFRPLIATPAIEETPAISPDGRWIAYMSMLSGRREVYVRPFPNVEGGVWQISTQGGVDPVWSHAGDEIYFRDISSLDLMAVSVTARPVFHAATPRVITHTEAAAAYDHTRYAVTPDGKRFLIVGASGARTEPQLIRAENLLQELKRHRAP